jgi:hypothetical protein
MVIALIPDLALGHDKERERDWANWYQRLSLSAVYQCLSCQKQTWGWVLLYILRFLRRESDSLSLSITTTKMRKENTDHYHYHYYYYDYYYYLLLYYYEAPLPFTTTKPYIENNLSRP